MDKPTWSLILDAARELASDGAEFSRAAIVAAVQRRDPGRRADSIGPVLQGMTSNASGGPPSPCGTPLIRVSHGWYRLADVSSATAAPRPVTAGQLASRGVDLVLVGCVKTKADQPQTARDLFRSPLFERRRRYAEGHAPRWYILSAEHGLVSPDALLEPYDTALAEQSQQYRHAWGQWVTAKLLRLEGNLHGRMIEIHAGDAYVAPLRAPLSAAGADVRHTVAGLPHGEQLAWYDQPTSALSDDATGPPTGVTGSRPITEAPEPPAPYADLTLLDGPRPAPPFTYQWPELTENFDKGWNLIAVEHGHRYTVKIGLGVRAAYGRDRRRLVVWVNGQPVAEAAGEDGYDTSHHLAGLLKDADGHMVRPGAVLPPPYVGFPIVLLTAVINGPHARGGLAVRLPEDDILGWTTFALARMAVRAGRNQPAPAKALPVLPPPSHPVDEARRTRIVAAILQYGRDHHDENAGRPPQFTPHAAANQLILDNPFAFLLAVIFDQGIPAERAWRAPYELAQRLGHLDPARIATEPARVAEAVARPPALHRFTATMPNWLVAAARRISRDYHGDAGAIWAGTPRAADLAARLVAFTGVGQKKSAMAVEILTRDLGVPVRELTGSDIAYDVHVRRVLLRTGLAERDDLDHMVAVARRLHPERPGELDFPMWLIGRRWCGPGAPDCAACVLHSICPQEVDRAAGISGN